MTVFSTGETTRLEDKYEVGGMPFGISIEKHSSQKRVGFPTLSQTRFWMDFVRFGVPPDLDFSGFRVGGVANFEKSVFSVPETKFHRF